MLSWNALLSRLDSRCRANSIRPRFRCPQPTCRSGHHRRYYLFTSRRPCKFRDCTFQTADGHPRFDCRWRREVPLGRPGRSRSPAERDPCTSRSSRSADESAARERAPFRHPEKAVRVNNPLALLGFSGRREMVIRPHAGENLAEVVATEFSQSPLPDRRVRSAALDRRGLAVVGVHGWDSRRLDYAIAAIWLA